ncbi:helix-turn-helix domain-containing protein [Desulfoluna spongiiphila]|uniref:helix-turn-helix domain-containing protein n=1 Tax=Desulfoluna spongiiphila TaxID=419481 RepID=UPI001250D4EA|nr:helix-turn-helix domain-containing protein [Desulfoluna spongiiphila]VVS95321.1 bacteriophage ci repressor [Desulfoluna spongiiphila]
MIDLGPILSRLKEAANLSFDKDIAVLLGISAPDFSMRKKRGSLLPIIIEWAINNNVNLDWLIKGATPLKTAVNGDTHEDDEVVKEHIQIAKMFKNKVIAKEINWDLIKLEQVDQAALKELHEYIKFKLQMKKSEGLNPKGLAVGKKAANDSE